MKRAEDLKVVTACLLVVIHYKHLELLEQVVNVPLGASDDMMWNDVAVIVCDVTCDTHFHCYHWLETLWDLTSSVKSSLVPDLQKGAAMFPSYGFGS
jgi:hypothetical protein